MITLRKIVFDISELLNANSDDSRFSEEHIAYTVGNKRNMLLKQYMSNLTKEIPLEATQAVCLSLEVDDACLDDEKVLKSILKVPSTLHNTGRSGLVKVVSNGSHFTKNFNTIEYSRLPYLKGKKYIGTQTFIAVDPDSYLIVYNTEDRHILIDELKVIGIFEDPEAAYLLSCEDNSKDFWDVPYPIESALVDMLKTQVVKELSTKYQLPEDEINDGEDSIPVRNGK